MPHPPAPVAARARRLSSAGLIGYAGGMRLEVRSLTCSRGGRPAFRDLGFGLDAGGLLVLRGPNGAGKTTLLRALAGLASPDSGEIRLGGLAAGADGWEEQVAYAGHLDGLKPQLTLLENLRFWAALSGAPAAAADTALAAVGLEGLGSRPAGACSAGQKRRAGLARVLLVPRVLWLLDEPTVALDAEATARLLRLLADHAAGGGLAIIATHVPLGLPGERELRLAGPATCAPAGPGDGDAGAGADPFLSGRWT